MSIALTNAFLIDGLSGAVEHATIVIEGDRIRAGGADVPVPDDATERVDLEGQAVLPGLIDLHAHIVGGNRAPGSNRYAYETVAYQLFDPDMPFKDPIGIAAFRSVPAAHEYIRNGITTIRDLGGRSYLACDLRDAIAAGLFVGPRIIAAGVPITSTGGVGAWWGWEYDGPYGVRRGVREHVKMGVDVIKCFGDGGADWSTPSYTFAELDAVVDEAHRKQKRCTCHCMSAGAIIDAARAGFDSIEHCGSARRSPPP